LLIAKLFYRVELKGGVLCLAHHDHFWHRAEILRTEKEVCALTMIDSGKIIQDYPCRNLLRIPSSIARIPPLSISAQLGRIERAKGRFEW
jgi:Tudor domain